MQIAEFLKMVESAEASGIRIREVAITGKAEAELAKGVAKTNATFAPDDLGPDYRGSLFGVRLYRED